MMMMMMSHVAFDHQIVIIIIKIVFGWEILDFRGNCTVAWVTRPERPKGRKLEVGARRAPRLLVHYKSENMVYFSAQTKWRKKLQQTNFATKVIDNLEILFNLVLSFELASSPITSLLPVWPPWMLGSEPLGRSLLSG